MTHTEIDALTPEEVHDEILHRLKIPLNLKGQYPLDDNLMREARKLLDTELLQRMFIDHLYNQFIGRDFVSEFRRIDMPPLDQARAFLKTMEGRE